MFNNDDLCSQSGAYWKCECVPVLSEEELFAAVAALQSQWAEEDKLGSEWATVAAPYIGPTFSRDAILVIKDGKVQT